jgi:hypothetical protein
MLSSLPYQALFGGFWNATGNDRIQQGPTGRRIRLRSGYSLYKLGASAAKVVPIGQLAISPRRQRHLGAGAAGKLKLFVSGTRDVWGGVAN